MIRYLKKWIFGLSLLSASCSTSYTIVSIPPGIEIFDGAKSLGPTPLQISSSDIDESSKQAGGFIVSIKDDVHFPVNIWLADNKRTNVFTIKTLNFRRELQEFTRSPKDKKEKSKETVVIDNAFIDKILRYQVQLLGTKEPAEEPEFTSVESSTSAVSYLKAMQLLRNEQKDQAIRFIEDAISRDPNEIDYISLKNDIMK